jgi:hypothetical protein
MIKLNCLYLVTGRTLEPLCLRIGDQQQTIQEIKETGRQLQSHIQNSIWFIIPEPHIISDMQVQVMKKGLHLIKNVPWYQIRIQGTEGVGNTLIDQREAGLSVILRWAG